MPNSFFCLIRLERVIFEHAPVDALKRTPAIYKRQLMSDGRLGLDDLPATLFLKPFCHPAGIRIFKFQQEIPFATFTR